MRFPNESLNKGNISILAFLAKCPTHFCKPNQKLSKTKNPKPLEAPSKLPVMKTGYKNLKSYIEPYSQIQGIVNI